MLVFCVGNTADYDLAKVLDRKEKRKRDGSKENKARKTKSFRPFAPKGASAPPFLPLAQNLLATGYGGGAPNHPPPGQGPSGGYGQRAETRTCLICKQVGHLYRYCPNKSSAAAAMGQAPK